MPATVILGVAALLLLLGLGVYLAPLEPGVLALQFAATPRAFGLVIHLWTAEQLALYRSHFAADFALLACYGAFGWRLSRRTPLFARAPARARKLLPWTLPLAAAFDAAENALHLWLTAEPRFGVAPLYLASASCAALKWTLLLGFALAALHAWSGSKQ